MQEVTTCPRCGADRAGGARFCPTCGLDFNAPAGEQSPPAPPPPPVPQAPVPPAQAPAGHTITVKTEGIVATIAKVMGVSVGCGCAAIVIVFLLFVLILWFLAGG